MVAPCGGRIVRDDPASAGLDGRASGPAARLTAKAVVWRSSLAHDLSSALTPPNAATLEVQSRSARR